MDPASIRARIIRQVDGCFLGSGGANATHRQKVGADCWFHFYKEPKGCAAVHLAIDSSIKLERLAQTYRQLYKEDVRVAMGINTVRDLRLDVSGPYDEDSIIAYYLTRQQIVQYHKRATRDAVDNLVDAPKRPCWKRCGTFAYCDGRQIEIYGHTC